MGRTLQASYTLRVKSKSSMRPMVQRARLLPAGTALDQPVWLGGWHSFQKTFRSEEIDHNTAWPWQTAVICGAEKDVRFTRDIRVGHEDSFSLKVENLRSAASTWQATTLGPAFGERAFRSGGRLRLRGMVRLRGAEVKARVVLRLHRKGKGSVYAVSDYELYPSAEMTEADREWHELTVTTPRLRPAPDRVHVLLQLEGRGAAWFDEVELSRLR